MPSRRLLRLLVASGQMLAVEELARDFARRLRAFAVSLCGVDPINTADWSILATERVVWRLVRRETWRPAFFRYEPHDPQRPDVRVNVHAPYLAAFDQVWPHLDYPRWVEAHETWAQNGSVTPALRILRTLGSLVTMAPLGPDLWASVARRVRPDGRRRTRPLLERAREDGATPHGLTIQAESLVMTARRAEKVWPPRGGGLADPFAPLRAILDLGFAVHDVTSRGVELACPLPPRPRGGAARAGE